MPGTKRKGKGDAWYFEVTIGSDFDGKPIRYNKTFHGTEKQAEKALATFWADCEAGRINRGKTMTVADLAKIYNEEYVKKYLKQSNEKAVSPAIYEHIIPLLGRKKVTKLSRLDVQQWVNKISEEQKKEDRKGNVSVKKLSPKTIKNYYSILSGMMKYAIRMDIIDRSPCHDIILPKNERKEARYYNKEEVALFLKALEDVPEDELKYKVAVSIALFGGLRNGEIVGLNWSDFDPENKTISIERTRLVKKGGTYEDTPKTKKSIRTVTLPDNVITLLHQLSLQQKKAKLALGDKWIDSPALLKNEFGAPMYPKAPARWLAAFIKKSDLPYISMHGLRHTHTSLLAYLDMDKLSISRRLGHSQLSTTLNIYTHLFKESDREIAKSLNIFTENLRKMP